MNRTKNELLESIKNLNVDNLQESVIPLLEDIEDTFTNSEHTMNETKAQITKLEKNYSDLQEKYKNRFYSGEQTPKDPIIEPITEAPKSYNFLDLFNRRNNNA